MVSEIVTAVISPIAIALITTYLNNKYAKNRDKNKKIIDENETKSRLAAAFLAEITALMEQYDKIGGALLQKSSDGKPQYYTTNIDDDFFTIYNKNADKLGFFDKDLIGEIVRLYTSAKGFVCTIKTWNNLVNEPRSDSELNDYYQIVKKFHSDVFKQAKKVTTKLNAIS